VEIYICEIGKSYSADFSKNLQRIPPHQNIKVYHINKGDALPDVLAGKILIDAIFGSGLNRAVTGYWGEVLAFFNQQNQPIVSIDIPSGVFADQRTVGISVQADYTFSFQTPKLAFFFPENEKRIGKWYFDEIGLHADFYEKTKTSFFYLLKKDVQQILRPRAKFSHKGTFGHGLLIAGSYGKMGAAILAAKAALRSGAGLITTHVPKCGYTLLQTAFPEAMVSVDEHEFCFSKITDFEKYNAIGIGCGLGTNALSAQGLKDFLEKVEIPIVLDADALNLISQNKTWLKLIPPGSILTPHPKEFARLFGPTDDHFERNKLQRTCSKKHNIYVVLKGANTCVSTPQGHCYFNSTGNPGMATAGSGDVLTGILLSLLAQGYNPLDACLLGVYLHGLSGDLALDEVISQESLIASDLIDNLGKAFSKIR
ncbi:MAG: NAD(P)H-hydrate dehydratase, partial [Bacteroidota bacterium]